MHISLLLLFLAADWGQFRGPNASGVSTDVNLPAELRPDRNVVWKTTLPPGYSSPSVAGDRIFITALDDHERLLTIALDRASGRILWRREAPRPRKQEMQRANSAVSATPATDGMNVYSFFQDFGLIGYGPDGNELWRMPMGPFNNPFGHGSSPVLTTGGGTLIMNIDQDTGSYLLALDAKSGKIRWRTPRDHAQRGYATPIFYGNNQIVVTGSYRMSGYDLATGNEIWSIGGLPWQIKPTPVIHDGVVYFVTFSGESDPGEQEKVPPFAEALKLYDRNKDGRISKDELPDPKAQARFEEYLDLDHTGFLEERDWERFRDRRAGESALRAYKIESAKGDITESGFLWKNSKTLPNVPSPLFYQGVLYTLKEGGIFSSFNPKTGEVLKQARLQGALGTYYASPVAADGKIYLANEDGKTVVLKAGAQWEILSTGEFDAGIKATPAITGGRIYLRTHNALYCFTKKE